MQNGSFRGGLVGPPSSTIVNLYKSVSTPAEANRTLTKGHQPYITVDFLKLSFEYPGKYSNKKFERSHCKCNFSCIICGQYFWKPQACLDLVLTRLFVYLTDIWIDDSLCSCLWMLKVHLKMTDRRSRPNGFSAVSKKWRGIAKWRPPLSPQNPKKWRPVCCWIALHYILFQTFLALTGWFNKRLSNWLRYESSVEVSSMSHRLVDGADSHK